MGNRRTTRPQFIGIRLTDNELADLDRLMAEAGYRNRSLFGKRLRDDASVA